MLALCLGSKLRSGSQPGIVILMGDEEEEFEEAAWASGPEQHAVRQIEGFAVREILSMGYTQAPPGGRVWAESVALAREVAALDLGSKTVCELGAGCGLVMLAAAKAHPQCRLWASDHHTVVLDNLAHNLELNGLRDRVSLEELHWESVKTHALARSCDAVLGAALFPSDDAGLAAVALEAIEALLHPGGFAVLAMRFPPPPCGPLAWRLARTCGADSEGAAPVGMYVSVNDSKS